MRRAVTNSGGPVRAPAESPGSQGVAMKCAVLALWPGILLLGAGCASSPAPHKQAPEPAEDSGASETGGRGGSGTGGASATGGASPQIGPDAAMTSPSGDAAPTGEGGTGGAPPAM